MTADNKTAMPDELKAALDKMLGQNMWREDDPYVQGAIVGWNAVADLATPAPSDKDLIQAAQYFERAWRSHYHMFPQERNLHHVKTIRAALSQPALPVIEGLDKVLKKMKVTPAYIGYPDERAVILKAARAYAAASGGEKI